MSDEKGWAVISGKTLVNTVSETRRAAIVNYLVAHRGIAVTNAWNDDDIERAWAHWGAYSECRQVTISPVVAERCAICGHRKADGRAASVIGCAITAIQGAQFWNV